MNGVSYKKGLFESLRKALMGPNSNQDLFSKI